MIRPGESAQCQNLVGSFKALALVALCRWECIFEADDAEASEQNWNDDQRGSGSSASHGWVLRALSGLAVADLAVETNIRASIRQRQTKMDNFISDHWCDTLRWQWRWPMVWAVDSVAVTDSNNKRNAGTRTYSMTAILSNNPLLVALRTVVAENPCNHWRSAETSARGASTWQGVKRLTEAPRSLSAPISAANQSGRLTLWVGADFSLLCLAILAGILDTNCTNSSCHPRHVLAWLGDTVSADSSDHLVAARLATHNAAQLLTLSAATVYDTNCRLRFASHSAALVSVTQTANMWASLSAATVGIT